MALTEKQHQILYKAEQLFAEKGFDGATVRDIADFAGVNLAMISYYFGSKEKLMEALFEHRMAATQAMLEEIVTNPSFTVVQKMEMMIDQYINKVMSQQSFYKVLLIEQVTSKNKTIIKLLKEYKLNYARLILKIVEEGKKAKNIKKDVDVVLLIGTLSGTVLQLLVHKEYYREFNGLKKMPVPAVEEHIKNRMSVHLKQVFKALLGYK